MTPLYVCAPALSISKKFIFTMLEEALKRANIIPLYTFYIYNNNNKSYTFLTMSCMNILILA